MSKTMKSTGDGTQRAGLRSPLIAGLGLLLVVQIVGALLLALGGSDLAPTASQGPLLDFEPETVTRLHIASGGERSLVLEKTGEGWKLPSLDGFPASEVKVSDLLAKVAAIQRRVPVATSEAAAARFRVAREGFERRLTLEGAQGHLGTLYLGDSPGFRRLFVRAEGGQAVYEAELALFDAPPEADGWTKKDLLQLEPDNIQGIGAAGMTLKRGEDGSWTLDDLTEGETLDQEAVEAFVRQVANVSFQGVLGMEDRPDYGQESAHLRLLLNLSGETREYVLSRLKEGEDYVLKVSSHPYYFRLSQFTAEGLAGVTRDGLLRNDAAPTAAEVQATSGAGNSRDVGESLPQSTPADLTPVEEPAADAKPE
jgi:hypothetical protein